QPAKISLNRNNLVVGIGMPATRDFGNGWMKIQHNKGIRRLRGGQ
ncbi:Uncharacterized protein APZ42_008824, partial [Daphnia magna]